MELEKLVPTWIQWSRENLPQTDTIPSIGDEEFAGPWRMEIDSISREFGEDIDSIAPELDKDEADPPDRLMTCFAGHLKSTPTDLPVRFTALDLYHGMIRSGILWDDDFCPLQRAERDFQRIIDNLSVEECPPDWIHTHWEIRAASKAKDWKRSVALYDRAEKLQLLDLTELQKLRGLLLFLIALGPALGLDLDVKGELSSVVEGAEWKPGHCAILEGDLFHEGLRVLDVRFPLAQADIQRLWAATNDFQDVVRTRPDTELATRSMLGMCLFAIGQFRAAAHHYELLTGKDPSSFKVVESPTDVDIAVAIAVCYKRAGEEKQAQVILEEILSKYPRAPGLHLHLAELRAQQGDYRAAYESLRREVEINPNAEEELGIRLGLALGAAPGSLTEEELARKLAPKSDDPDVATMIAAGENSGVEFKSSARWDIRENRLNKALEKAIVKSVAGFLNSETQGTLLIGVGDGGKVVGLANDYLTLTKRDRDGYENWLYTLLLGKFGMQLNTFIQITFHGVAGQDVCQVAVKPAPKAATVKDGDVENFFLRIGNSTRPLPISQAIEYSKYRWK